VSRPQDTGYRCRVFSVQECLLIINNRLRISRQSKRKGCETPNALSSITMVEEGAAMKVIQTKNSLHSRRKTERL